MSPVIPSRFRRSRGRHAPAERLGRDATPDSLSAVRAHQNLLVSAKGTEAWFVLGDVDWQYRPGDEREALLGSWAARLAELAPHQITIRLTSAPFNRLSWVTRLAKDFPADPAPGDRYRSKRLPDVPGASSFDDVLMSAQEEMVALDARSSAVLLAVNLTGSMLSDADLRNLGSPTPLTNEFAGLEELRRDLRNVSTIVSKAGMNGRPMSANALGWLIHASVGLGLSVPPVLLSGRRQDWEPDEVPGFTSGVAVTAEPFAATTTVHAVRGGAEQESHVAVLQASRFEERDETGGIPAWLSWFGTLPYGVDLVACFDLLPPAMLKAEAEKNRRRLDDQIEHYGEHGDTPPASVIRARDLASQVEDDTASGGREQTRARGVVLAAVTGPTPDDALDVANDLVSRAVSEVGVTFVHGLDQYHLAKSMIPGEPVTRTGLITQMRVDFLAAGVPNASAKCGDSTGFFVGPVAGGHDIMLFDPHGGSARNRSNLMVVGAAPGVAGKSSLGAALMDWTARGGEQTLGLDPADQWWRIAGLPHLERNARHLDLLSARRGTLTPSTLVPDPQREDFETAEEWDDAMVEASDERRDLTIDTLRDLLPFNMTNGDTTGRVIGSIEAAVAEVGGHFGADPWKIVDELERMGEVAREVAARLKTRAELKDGRLIFPEREVIADHPEIRSATLTIIGLKGLTLPPKDNPHRATWTRKQQQSIPVLNLASWLALSAMYADKSPTNIHMDELSMVVGGAGGSFAPFLTRASADSRKWNTLVSLYFQNPEMLTAVSGEISNLVGCSWVGNMTREVARKAAPLLHLPESSGAEKVIASLGPGEWLHLDWRDRLRKVRVDRDWWDAATFAAIDTNPQGEGMYDEGGLEGIFDDEGTFVDGLRYAR